MQVRYRCANSPYNEHVVELGVFVARRGIRTLGSSLPRLSLCPLSYPSGNQILPAHQVFSCYVGIEGVEPSVSRLSVGCVYHLRHMPLLLCVLVETSPGASPSTVIVSADYFAFLNLFQDRSPTPCTTGYHLTNFAHLLELRQMIKLQNHRVCLTAVYTRVKQKIRVQCRSFLVAVLNLVLSPVFRIVGGHTLL